MLCIRYHYAHRAFGTFIAYYRNGCSIVFGESNGIASVEASGGTAPYAYLWSNGETTDTITGLPIGDYTVVVTDSLGCIDSATVTVTEPPLLTAVADSVDVLCFGTLQEVFRLLLGGNAGLAICGILGILHRQ